MKGVLMSSMSSSPVRVMELDEAWVITPALSYRTRIWFRVLSDHARAFFLQTSQFAYTNIFLCIILSIVSRYLRPHFLFHTRVGLRRP